MSELTQREAVRRAWIAAASAEAHLLEDHHAAARTMISLSRAWSDIASQLPFTADAVASTTCRAGAEHGPHPHDGEICVDCPICSPGRCPTCGATRLASAVFMAEVGNEPCVDRWHGGTPHPSDCTERCCIPPVPPVVAGITPWKPPCAAECPRSAGAEFCRSEFCSTSGSDAATAVIPRIACSCTIDFRTGTVLDAEAGCPEGHWRGQRAGETPLPVEPGQGGSPRMMCYCHGAPGRHPVGTPGCETT